MSPLTGSMSGSGSEAAPWVEKKAVPAPVIRFLIVSDHPQETLFAFRIPALPDFLADHMLLGSTPAEKLDEVLERFQRLAIALRKYRGSAFALRFWSQPALGKIDLFLVCRLRAIPDGPIVTPSHAAADISALLVSYGIPYEPVTTGDALSLETILQPFGHKTAMVEARQHEQVVNLMTVNWDAYVIHPYWKPQGLFLEPFETMLRLTHPCVISVYLEPTELSEDEFYSLGEAGYLAQTVADYQVPTLATTSVSRRRDPGAELIGRIYTQYLNALSEPFIMVIQAASPDANTAWTALRAYTNCMIKQRPSVRDAGPDSNLPSAADIEAPSNNDEYNRAIQIFSRLNWFPWGRSSASQFKERIRYLVGAGGASAAFRFPVSNRGGVPGVAVHQPVPDFEPGPRPSHPGVDEIHLGNFRRGGCAVAVRRDLTRHVLVTGFTGSGKTNTVLYLLDQLWRKLHTPFLVVEAAKKEYRALARVPGFEDLLVFTLGDETTSPFRLNPFELLPGVRLEAHLSRLQACFDAAMPQFGILPSIIQQAMIEIYAEKGWNLKDYAVENEKRMFPTMRDLFRMAIQVVNNRGYEGEIRSNILAAVSGRIGSLLMGSKGAMYGCQHSFPADVLLRRPVILELDDLNGDEKALSMMFLLTWLREYRTLHPSDQLQHVTVVEEAHNVLSNVHSVGNTEIAADTKVKAVDAFSNMLSEVRSMGEGLVISDQSPEKLAPDAMRNTNLQIAHQLRDQRDREAIARAMIMDEKQRDYIGKLQVGEAAVFMTGLEQATFIRVPEFKDTAGFGSLPSAEFIRSRMDAFGEKHLKASLPYDGCQFCKQVCHFREGIEPQTLVVELTDTFQKSLKLFDRNPQPEHWSENWRKVAEVCLTAAERAGYQRQLNAGYCYLVHEIDFKFNEHMRRSFECAVREIVKGG